MEQTEGAGKYVLRREWVVVEVASGEDVARSETKREVLDWIRSQA